MTCSPSVTIPRLDNGHVDPASSHAKAVRRALGHIGQLDPNRQAQAVCELLPKLHTLGWWELFNRLAHPKWVPAEPAYFHRQFWQWAMSIGATRPRPFAAIWPRGAAKTTQAQLWLAWWIVDQADPRDYAIYVGANQKQAERKIADIAALVQSPLMRHAFPESAAAYRDNRGHERDWTKGRIRFGNGRAIDALGMDVAIRGIKVEEQRPGIIVLDDLEEVSDSPYMTGKKLDVVGTDILGARATNGAVLYVQNLIKPDSIMNQLAGSEPPILTDRIASGPHPQIRGLEFVRVDDEELGTHYKITKGTPTWPEGLSLETSEGEITDLGPRYFLREKQHDVSSTEGALWDHDKIRAMTRKPGHVDRQAGGIVEVVIGVDPSVGDGTAGECGIVVAGRAHDGHVYVLEDASLAGRPSAWCKRLVEMYNKYGATYVIVERNHGQELLRDTIGRYSANLPIELVNAKKGKKLRAEPIATLSDTGRVWLAGDFPLLDFQMRTYTGAPNEDSPDRLDAFVYAVSWLLPVESGIGDMLSVSTPNVVRR